MVRTALGEFVEVSFPACELEDAVGMRADVFLSKRLRRYSRAEVRKLIAEGKVFLRGAPAKAATRLRAGDTVVVRYARTAEQPPAHSSLDILYEDEALVAVNKPGDLIVHPTDKVVLNTVLSILREQIGASFLSLAHRLDRETSGVLVLAKDAAAASALQGQFERRETRKEYLALVQGAPGARRFAVDAPLGPAGGEILVQQAVRADGAASRTDFAVLARGPGAALIRARPLTGRLHQIRAHLAHAGYPVLGDKLYCGGGEAYLKAVAKSFTPADAEALGAARQMLHARRLRLAHPRTGKPLLLTAPVPEDFRGLARDVLGYPVFKFVQRGI